MIEPIVSIIIPCYNREKLIPETLDSVINQAYPDWEAIVVDDGSTDSSLQVVGNYCSKEPRIKLYKRDHEPKNAAVCRNIGIEKAKGKYLVFLDSDDLLTSDSLFKRVNYMENNLNLDFAVFQMASFDINGIIEGIEIVKQKDNYLYAYLRHDLPWAITCPIWKTDFVKKNLKGYNEKYPRLQDPEFNTRALMVENIKYNVLFDSIPDCYYRSHTDKNFNTMTLLSGFELYIEEFSEKSSIY